MVLASMIYLRYIYPWRTHFNHSVQFQDIYIYKGDEILVDFDHNAGTDYVANSFSLETLAVSQIMEYLKWKNQRACEVTKKIIFYSIVGIYRDIFFKKTVKKYFNRIFLVE